jgi:glycosyltransferase involved in cell wall biosynthesis
MRQASAPTVTVSIPYFGCGLVVRRAVESILAQDHDALTVIVLNDGDERAPWSFLADIRDPRLVCFDLACNRGPYFAHAVALEASNDPYFLVQDADDWSAPDRIATLLDRMLSDGNRWASSGVALHEAVSERSTVLYSFRFCGDLDVTLTPDCRHRVGHHALYSTAALKSLGGYYAGFRIGFDTLLMNLCLMVHPHSHVGMPLYHSVRWPRSLTQHPDTGFRSPFRRAVRREIDAMYAEAYSWYGRYGRGTVSAGRLLDALRGICQRRVPVEERVALGREAARLRDLMRSRAPRRGAAFHRPSVARPRASSWASS